MRRVARSVLGKLRPWEPGRVLRPRQVPATVRTVRHPIAMFVVVVLAVIGVGVGLVSGLPVIAPLRAYGTAPLRFQAAFPTGLVGTVRVISSTPGIVMLRRLGRPRAA